MILIIIVDSVLLLIFGIAVYFTLREKKKRYTDTEFVCEVLNYKPIPQKTIKVKVNKKKKIGMFTKGYKCRKRVIGVLKTNPNKKGIAEVITSGSVAIPVSFKPKRIRKGKK